MLNRFVKRLLARPANQRSKSIDSPAQTELLGARQNRNNPPDPLAHSHAAALNERGLLHLHAGELALAEASFQASLQIDSGLAEAWSNLGIVSGMRRNHAQSLEYFTHARSLQARSPGIENNMAMALRELNRHVDACALLHSLVGSGVADADTVITLATIEREIGKPTIAESLLQTLPAGTERDAVLALVLLDVGRADEALRLLNANLIQHPHHHQSRMARGMVRIATGDYEGWRDYEARRFMAESPLREIARAQQWQGEPLHGSRVLVYAEQGVGDEIMFAHCVPDLIRDAAEVTIETEPRLAKLFQRSFQSATVIGHRRDKAENPSFASSFDFQMPVGSLPSVYRRAAAHFGNTKGYLRADPYRTQHYRSLRKQLPPLPTIGIAWRGGLVRTRSTIRSLGTSDCNVLFSSLRGNLVSLQHDVTDQELVEACSATTRPIQYAEAFLDFDETAALINSLDAIVTVCGSIAHLSGALGKPVWVLVPTAAEWRYGMHGSKMPWYPSMTMVRQSSAGDWLAPVAEVVRLVNSLSPAQN